MKKLLLIFLLVQTVIQVNAQDFLLSNQKNNEPDEIHLVDSSNEESMSQNKITRKEININILTGLGIIREVGDFGDKFNNSALFTLGIEYPNTNIMDNFWAFQLRTHYWRSFSNKNPNKNIYYHISGNDYSQLSFDLVLKAYFLNFQFVRNSFEIGYYKSVYNNEYQGFDLGYNLYFLLNEDYKISLSYNFGIYSPSEKDGAMLFNFLHLYSVVNLNFYYNVNIGN